MDIISFYQPFFDFFGSSILSLFAGYLGPILVFYSIILLLRSFVDYV